jgi:hypothetical protein
VFLHRKWVFFDGKWVFYIGNGCIQEIFEAKTWFEQ